MIAAIDLNASTQPKEDAYLFDKRHLERRIESDRKTDIVPLIFYIH